MKLEQLYEDQKKSDSDSAKNAPPPGDLGEFLTSKQSAAIAKVDPSRIRQAILAGELKSHQPEKGRRDHLIRRSDLMSWMKNKPDPGRPAEDDNK